MTFDIITIIMLSQIAHTLIKFQLLYT